MLFYVINITLNTINEHFSDFKIKYNNGYI